MNIDRSKINPEIKEAMDGIMQRYEEVKKDTSRPKYHFASPSQMLSDVWGGVYHNGYYHLFYDINHVDGFKWQNGAFGHLISTDLVEWEDMPLALLPETDKDEFVLNDGCVVITPDNKPLMYYTRVYTNLEIDREHIAVFGSDDLIFWERANNGEAILTMENHGGPKFARFWSDPIIFTESGRTFMIISKCNIPGEGDVIPIYEACDDALLKWEYRGIFANHTGEVLNFIKIKDKWVLIYSPYKNPKYFVGYFNIDTFKFEVEKEGTLSYGYINQGILDDISRGFYATNSFYGENQKVYIIGWISGFINPKGWDGCVSLTRELELDEENNVIMKPIETLDNLREERLCLDKFKKAKCPRTFEVDAEFELSDDIVISVKDSFKFEITNNKVKFNDIEFSYNTGETLKLKMYVDVSVAEIFIDDGKISLSRCFNQMSENSYIEVNTNCNISKFGIYKMKNLYM